MGSSTLISSAFTALLNCAEVGRRNRILTNNRFLSHSLACKQTTSTSNHLSMSLLAYSLFSLYPLRPLYLSEMRQDEGGSIPSTWGVSESCRQGTIVLAVTRIEHGLRIVSKRWILLESEDSASNSLFWLYPLRPLYLILSQIIDSSLRWSFGLFLLDWDLGRCVRLSSQSSDFHISKHLPYGGWS